MGRNTDPFVSLAEAAKRLSRTQEEVVSLCDEGLIRRRSTGYEVTVHSGDVEEVRETNLNNLARPRDLVRKVLILEREVEALKSAINIMGAANGFLSSSLQELSTDQLVSLSETACMMGLRGEWTTEEMLTFSEIFLKMADSDILRLNSTLGSHDSWRVYYELCLKMCMFSREGNLPETKDLETARILLHRGLRNLRSIGVLFIENKHFLQSSRELLESTMSHDIIEFDTLIKKLKSSNGKKGGEAFMQNY